MLYITNAFSLNMLPDNFSGSINFHPVSLQCVQALLQYEEFISAVGHADTAAVISSLTKIEITANRVNVSLLEDTTLLVAQYKGPRLPEGTTTLPEGASIEWYQVCID